MKISVIVTTYNWPEALNAVLITLQHQMYQGFEVVIADDGSTTHTREMISDFKNQSFDLKHVWQEDLGFRAARVRNLGALKATGDILIFLDGDCLCPPNFIANHIKLNCSNHLVSGNRSLLTKQETQSILQNASNIESYKNFFHQRFKLKQLPLGPLRDFTPRNWAKVRSCNMSITKRDFFKIDGFDESYEGWGKEDSDLAIRALNAGMKIRLGQFSTTVLHLHHNEASREDLEENIKRLNDLKKSKRIQPLKSLLNGN